MDAGHLRHFRYIYIAMQFPSNRKLKQSIHSWTPFWQYRETAALNHLLSQLVSLSSPAVSSPSGRGFSALSGYGTIQSCKALLERLDKLLAKCQQHQGERVANLIRVLSWPALETEVNKLLQDVHRLQDLFRLALSIDKSYVPKTIYIVLVQIGEFFLVKPCNASKHSSAISASTKLVCCSFLNYWNWCLIVCRRIKISWPGHCSPDAIVNW